MGSTKIRGIKYVAYIVIPFFILMIAPVPESYAQKPQGQSQLPRLLQQKLYGPLWFQKKRLAQKVQASKPVIPPPSKSKCGPTTCDELLAKASRNGSVNVIVFLDIPNLPNHSRAPGKDRPAIMRAREAAIRQAQDAFLQRMSAHKVRVGTKFKLTPGLGVTVDAAALQDLIADPAVKSVGEELPMRPMLNQSVPLVGADKVWTSGFTGSGYSIAILDTGVDSTHSFLADRVNAEACFSGTVNGTASLCPDGQTSQYGPGAAAPCDLAGCEHGTHVAGITAGAGPNFSGVAKGADLVAVQVFSRINDPTTCVNLGTTAPCIASFPSNQINALDYVSSLFANVAAVNLSLGGGAYANNCDSDAPWDVYKTSIDTLRSEGIATVVAAGNDGMTNAVSAPACISTSVSVGATTKSDAVASYSNSVSFLSLLAPGGDGSTFHSDGTLTYSADCSELLPDICSSVPAGSPAPFAYDAGTSMAAPHVAGAFAVLRSQSPTASVSDILSSLQSTGVPVADPRNSFTKPRIALANGIPWIARYNGYGNGVSVAVATDISGNVYVTGSTWSAGPNPAIEGEYATVKYDSSGHQLWVSTYAAGVYGEPGAIAVDGSGNVYVTGSVCTAYIPNQSPGCAHWVAGTVKYNPNGQQLWASTYGVGNATRSIDMALDNQGSVYITGYSCIGTGLPCAISDTVVYTTVKYDSDGNQLWSASYTNMGDDIAIAITIDTNENAYVTGRSCDALTCLAATVKYGPNGNQIWVIQDTNLNYGADIVVDTSGNSYVTGEGNSSENPTVKYDSGGQLLWVGSGQGGGIALVLGTQNNIYATGQYLDTVSDDHKYATTKYDTSGNNIWTMFYTNGISPDREATAIVLDGADNIYVTGHECGTDDSSCDSWNYVTIKYSPNGDQLWLARYTGAENYFPSLALRNSNVYIAGISCTNDDCETTDYITVGYALPTTPSPPPSTELSITAGNGWNMINWGAVSGATSYNIYWSTTPGVTPSTGTKIANVTSPYIQTGLSNGITYYYIVVAVNAAGESFASNQLVGVPVQAGGDLNSDGLVDVADLAVTKEIALSRVIPTGTQLANGDVTGDGIINVADVVRIQDKALGLASF